MEVSSDDITIVAHSLVKKREDVMAPEELEIATASFPWQVGGKQGPRCWLTS